MSGIDGKEIQHLYRLSLNGHAVYDRTEIINVYNVAHKTTIVHLLILPESKPDTDYAKVKSSFQDELPTRTEVLDRLIDAGTEQEEDEIVDELPEIF